MQSTLSFLASAFGEASVPELLGALEATDRAQVEQVRATDEVPYALLVRVWERADAVVRALDAAGDPALGDAAAGDPAAAPSSRAATWAEEAGEASIGSFGVQLYGGILRKPSPLEFLTQSISLFRLYYQPGDMEVVESVPGRAVLRLVGFDPRTSIFCRRQTGGLRRAVALAGGGEARARHVRCVLEGDAFCEWELHWHPLG